MSAQARDLPGVWANSTQLCVLGDAETADGQVHGRAGENIAREEDPHFQPAAKVCPGSGFRERQRGREREIEKEKEREREAKRQTEKEREKQKEKEKQRERGA